MPTIEECFQEIGNDLSALLKRVIPEQNLMRWFYETTIPALGGTPAQAHAREGSAAIMVYFENRFIETAGMYDGMDDYA